MNDIITITPKAWKKIQHKIDIADEKYNGVRIDVRTTGCSGYSYKFDLTNDDPMVGEEYVENDGYKVIISAYATMFVAGAILDYVIKDKLTQGFDFINKLEQGRCGCGESFTI